MRTVTRLAAIERIPAPRQVTLDGITLTAGTHPAGSALPWHDHAGPTMCMVLDGAFAEYQRGSVIDCRPSTFKITPAREQHWNRFHLSDVRGLLIEIDPGHLAHLEPFDRVLTRAYHSEGGAESLYARRLHAEFLAEDDAAPLAMEGVLLELLACIARQGGTQGSVAPRWVQKARELLQDSPGRRFALAEIAAEVGVQPGTLARGFRQAYGCSVGEMQRRLRLELAARQLATTELTLAAIAQQAGFFDQSHLTNAFRRYLGTSPQRYRRTVRPPA